MKAKNNVSQWCEENKNNFLPPICNKLMHMDQLSVMFVGGPNTRTDFHIDEGSEFFYQVKGNIELPIVEQGKRRLIKINQGEVFLLPSRIPHSPQRPEKESLGLVIERQRNETEMDCLRFYVNFEDCKEILWEKYFHCADLVKQLPPIVGAYKNSTEFTTRAPGLNVVKDPPLKQDVTSKLPAPFSLTSFIEEHKSSLSRGEEVNLFPNHPDKEFSIKLIGGKSQQQRQQIKDETWLYQLKGDIEVEVQGKKEALKEGECGIIPPNIVYSVYRSEDSIGMVLSNNPLGNK